MKKYSDYFKTLYDEDGPTIELGRGTHYSVLRSIIWHNASGSVLPFGENHDLAIVWDEDHDERVISAVELLYREGMLSSVAVIGERKGMLTLLLSNDAIRQFGEAGIEVYRKRAERVCGKIEGDLWSVTLGSLTQPEGIINAEESEVVKYIQEVDELWCMGVKPSFDYDELKEYRKRE